MATAKKAAAKPAASTEPEAEEQPDEEQVDLEPEPEEEEPTGPFLSDTELNSIIVNWNQERGARDREPRTVRCEEGARAHVADDGAIVLGTKYADKVSVLALLQTFAGR